MVEPATRSPHNSDHKKRSFEISSDEYGLTTNSIDIHFTPSEYGIVNNYEPIKEIYRVQLSPTVVYLAEEKSSHKVSENPQHQKKFIKKCIQKAKLMSQTQVEYARRECSIHKGLGEHQNIVELYDYTESEEEIILFMDYCNKADYISQKIEDNLSPFKNQEKLQSFIHDMIDGLDYIHSRGVIHSDMKLQNALVHKEELSEEDEYPVVKLCDFGLSHLTSKEYHGKAMMAEVCGTTGYIAPEIKGKNSIVGPEIDMWGLGVMMYEMCVAYKPTKVLNYKYGSGPIPFRDRDWREIPKSAKNLIEACLVLEPEKRLLPHDALQHPYFEEEF